MFYTYDQSNPGGHYHNDDKLGHYVIIEANSGDHADKLAGNIGIEFNEYEDRWFPMGYSEGKEEPMIGDLTIEGFKKDPHSYPEKVDIHIYYKNEEHEVINIDAIAIIKKKEAAEREVADKIWGTKFSFNSGFWSKRPVKLYKSKRDAKYYDEKGNMGVRSGLDVNSEYGLVSFSSKNKKDVKDFADGIKDAFDILKSSLLDSADSFEGIKVSSADVVLRLLEGIKY